MFQRVWLQTFINFELQIAKQLNFLLSFGIEILFSYSIYILIKRRRYFVERRGFLDLKSGTTLVKKLTSKLLSILLKDVSEKTVIFSINFTFQIFWIEDFCQFYQMRKWKIFKLTRITFEFLSLLKRISYRTRRRW